MKHKKYETHNSLQLFRINSCHTPYSPGDPRREASMYTTRVYRNPVKKPVSHKDIIKSNEFKGIKSMIADNNLQSVSLVPNLTHAEVRTVFALKTGGEDISDYWTMTAKEWDIRKISTGNKYRMATHSLLVNYIKKKQKCCVGLPAEHSDRMKHRPCCRDIQNVEPWRLSVSIYCQCQHVFPHLSYLKLTLLYSNLDVPL